MKHVGAMVQQGDASHVQCANQVAWKPTAQNSHWHYLVPAGPKEILESFWLIPIIFLWLQLLHTLSRMLWQ